MDLDLVEKKPTSFIMSLKALLEGNDYSIDEFIMVLDN